MPIADLFPGLFAQFTRTAHFDEKTIAAVEKLVINKNNKPYIECLVRQKEVLAKPEEIIRQLWLHQLLHRYKYPVSRIQVEYPIPSGATARSGRTSSFSTPTDQRFPTRSSRIWRTRFLQMRAWMS